MFLDVGEHAEDPTDPDDRLVAVNVIADRTDGRTRAMGRVQQRQRFRRRAMRPVGVVDAMPATACPYMLAEQLPGLRIEHADLQIVPLHVDVAPNPARRGCVIRGVDFDAAVEMDRADAEAVIAKRLEWQRAEGGAGRSSANIVATCRLVVP